MAYCELGQSRSRAATQQHRGAHSSNGVQQGRGSEAGAHGSGEAQRGQQRPAGQPLGVQPAGGGRQARSRQLWLQRAERARRQKRPVVPVGGQQEAIVLCRMQKGRLRVINPGGQQTVA